MNKAEQPKENQFREFGELTSEQLKDPDYRLKQLRKLSQGKVINICGKCGPETGRF